MVLCQAALPEQVLVLAPRPLVVLPETRLAQAPPLQAALVEQAQQQ
ncbi:hypothetical protein GCM10027277_46320 [Pseudoduganella ginsengisoli]